MSMGTQLHKAARVALRGNTKLSGNARAALLLMAMTAIDPGDKRGRTERIYFGGWLDLQSELRGCVTPATERAVGRALEELELQGLILRVRRSGRTTAAYELLIGATKGSGDD